MKLEGYYKIKLDKKTLREAARHIGVLCVTLGVVKGIIISGGIAPVILAIAGFVLIYLSALR